MKNILDKESLAKAASDTEETDDNSLAFARNFKPKLRFDVGDIVYLRSDIGRKCPMVIYFIENFEKIYDYRTEWLNSQKTREFGEFGDKQLME